MHLRTIRWDCDGVLLDARNRSSRSIPVESTRRLSSGPLPSPPADFDSIHYRTDPPVDLHYLHPLQLLALGVDGTDVELVNPAPLLFAANEKLEASALGTLMPPTLVAAEWSKLQGFGQTEGKTVLKPLHQAQSKGIELLDWSTEAGVARARAALQKATEEFERPVVLQRYLAGIADGEQRLWFVDGKLLACVRKLRCLVIFASTWIEAAESCPPPSLRASEAATRIAKHLVDRRIRLAAVDLIEGSPAPRSRTSRALD